MCGIFGFVSQSPINASFLLEGLKILEYRGYDSWGIAVKKGKRILTEKKIGKITSTTTRLPNSKIGIGHIVTGKQIGRAHV